MLTSRNRLEKYLSIIRLLSLRWLALFLSRIRLFYLGMLRMSRGARILVILIHIVIVYFMLVVSTVKIITITILLIIIAKYSPITI